MRYNQFVSNTLEKFEFDEFRKKNKESIIYDNQIIAGKNIIKAFTAHKESIDEAEARNNHVILCARMQSGKTGTCNGVVNILEITGLNHEFGIKKYFFISGMNEKGLSRQTLRRINGRDDSDLMKGDGQILDATYENTVFGDSEITIKPNGKYFIQKNSDLRKNSIKLENCLIFIDESHYGSGEENVLTTLLTNNGIDWKNRKDELKNKNIYIVSISATPFDEVISDSVECKEIINLEVSKGYCGVSNFLEKGLVMAARPEDFSIDNHTGRNKIHTIIEDAYNRMIDKKGIIFIRARDKKQATLIENKSIQEKFEIKFLDSKKTAINYELVNTTIELVKWKPDAKPVLFLIKGAYRAGITINAEHKDLVYLIYDYSLNRAETSAQGLLGRMCGYRSSDENINRNLFYVNLQHAEDYGDWELSEFNRGNTPTGKRWDWLEPGEKINSYTEYKMGTKGLGNFEIQLSRENVQDLVYISEMERGVYKKKCFIKYLKEHNLCYRDFDYIGEVYTSGRNTYGPSVQKKWFEAFQLNTSLLGYRPDSFFYELNGRDTLDFNRDHQRRIIHLVLDADYDIAFGVTGNKKLLVYYGELCIQKRVRNTERDIKEHKNTAI